MMHLHFRSYLFAQPQILNIYVTFQPENGFCGLARTNMKIRHKFIASCMNTECYKIKAVYSM